MRQLHCVFLIFLSFLPSLLSLFPLSHPPLFLSFARTWKVRTEIRWDFLRVTATTRSRFSGGLNYFKTGPFKLFILIIPKQRGKRPVSERSIIIELNRIWEFCHENNKGCQATSNKSSRTALPGPTELSFRSGSLAPYPFPPSEPSGRAAHHPTCTSPSHTTPIPPYHTSR